MKNFIPADHRVPHPTRSLYLDHRYGTCNRTRSTGQKCNSPIQYPGLDHSYCPGCAEWIPEQLTLPPRRSKSADQATEQITESAEILPTPLDLSALAPSSLPTAAPDLQPLRLTLTPPAPKQRRSKKPPKPKPLYHQPGLMQAVESSEAIQPTLDFGAIESGDAEVAS